MGKQNGKAVSFQIVKCKFCAEFALSKRFSSILCRRQISSFFGSSESFYSVKFCPPFVV